MSKPLSKTFEFDQVRMDVGNRRLIRDGEVVRLTPKAFDLLLLLVENHGKLIEREAIMKSLWSDAAVEDDLPLHWTVPILVQIDLRSRLQSPGPQRKRTRVQRSKKARFR
jgi:DNA-binding winged helix-turn-helix (wHTH) protein